MKIAEKKLQLSLFYYLLTATAEADIRSAHQPDLEIDRPRLPESLDKFYGAVVEMADRMCGPGSERSGLGYQDF